MNEFGESESAGGFGWFFNHLPSILWQRRWWIIVPFVAMTVASVIAAFTLKTVYESSATLLVQSQDLPSNLVDSPSSGKIEQRIAQIRERVLSRGDLISLIEQNDLYPDERKRKSLSTVVDKMRKDTSVGAVTDDIGQPAQADAPTVAIGISYKYYDPARAQKVLQSFVTNFLTMDSENIDDQAKLSVRFLQDQATDLRTQISAIENKITALKAANGSALAMSGAAPANADTGSYAAQIITLEAQNRQLTLQLQRPRRDSALAQAEAALADAQSRYADSHPDVIAARNRVAAARRAAGDGSSDGSTDAIRAQIQSNNEAIAAINAARASALSQSRASLGAQSRAPAILEQAMQLESQASALRDQYNMVSSNLLKAENSARMTAEQRAERLSLVEPPSLPDTPVWPNRPLLCAAGAAIGLLFGLLLALAVEFIARPLRSPAQLKALNLPLMGVVPPLGEVKRPSGLRPRFPRRSQLKEV